VSVQRVSREHVSHTRYTTLVHCMLLYECVLGEGAQQTRAVAALRYSKLPGQSNAS